MLCQLHYGSNGCENIEKKMSKQKISKKKMLKQLWSKKKMSIIQNVESFKMSLLNDIDSSCPFSVVHTFDIISFDIFSDVFTSIHTNGYTTFRWNR